jgi:DNA-binding NarL/FixJ family response regulator
MTARVLLADDQGLVRAGFRKILESEPGIEVVAEASDGEEAVAAARRFEPDVVLMDVRMPRLDGIAATRLITSAGLPARILMLTTFGHDEYVYDALRAGASGFLLKDVPPETLIDAVRIVARGDALLDPAVTRSVVEAFARLPETSEPSSMAELTAREREVLALLARGLSNAEICERLVVSEGTAKTHVARVLGKLGLRDRVQAVILAYECGLVRPGSDQ